MESNKSLDWWYLKSDDPSPRILASGQRPKPCGDNNHVSHRFKMWCISFVVQPGRSPGIKMCVCTPGISSKNNNIHKTALIVFRPCRCENVFKVWKLISPLIGDTIKVMIPLSWSFSVECSEWNIILSLVVWFIVEAKRSRWTQSITSTSFLKF